MCVCVVIPFILDVRLVDVPAGVTQEEGHTGFQCLPSAVLALFFLARKIQPFLFCFLTNYSLSICWAFFFSFLSFLFFCEEISEFVSLHRDSNSRPNVRRFRGY